MDIGSALGTFAAVAFIGVPVAALLKVIGSFYLTQSYNPKTLSKTVQGCHILITGGSKGFGLETALKLAAAGANVTIAARQSQFLDEALVSVQNASQVGAVARKVAVDLRNGDNTKEALRGLVAVAGRIDWVICAAGAATPGLISDQIQFGDDDTLRSQMDSNYFTAVNTVRSIFAIAKESVKKVHAIPPAEVSGFTLEEAAHLPTKIVIIGSALSFMTFIGYGAYSATRFALRGFSDALRHELKPLNIQVHYFSPGNMDTPGYAVENLTKPEITRKIEGVSALVLPAKAASAMLGGILAGRYYCSNDIVTELLTVANMSSGPRSNPISETLSIGLLTFIFVLWQVVIDVDVVSYFKKQSKFATSQ
ncbi:AP-1 complex subunit gamma-1 [Rhizoclosmatium sp. JEL0117]|nr:AP-1 complex subunit gamma-1 [Rhizoclosmatium sp. JEL0117]